MNSAWVVLAVGLGGENGVTTFTVVADDGAAAADRWLVVAALGPTAADGAPVELLATAGAGAGRSKSSGARPVAGRP